MDKPIYDQIGKTYDRTRHPDPQILQHILTFLKPQPQGRYLDLGCGSGNYTNALWQSGLDICGIDISEEMLAKAQKKNPQIQWIKGDARKLPFPDRSFEGVICVLATHHIKDFATSFREVHRVLRRGRFLIFTSFPSQMRHYWLMHYFPKMMKAAMQMMCDFEPLAEALEQAGFKHVTSHKFFITNELQDWFLHAGKYRPQIYLDPAVRADMSPFALQENSQEIQEGCQKLADDIASGKIKEIIQKYENDLGDYAFVLSEKEGIA